MPTDPPSPTRWILLHGLFGSPHSWQDATRAFLTRERVLPLWLPNHGQGPKGAFHTLDALADALLEAYPNAFAQEEKAPVLCGYSLGGTLALRLAQRLPQPPAAVLAVDAYLPGQQYPKALTRFLLAVAQQMAPLQDHQFESPHQLEQALRNQGIDPTTAHAIASAYPDGPCALHLQLGPIAEYLQRALPTNAPSPTAAQGPLGIPHHPIRPTIPMNAPIHAPLLYRGAASSIHSRHTDEETLRSLSPTVRRVLVPHTTHASIAQALLDEQTVAWLRKAASAPVHEHNSLPPADHSTQSAL